MSSISSSSSSSSSSSCVSSSSSSFCPRHRETYAARSERRSRERNERRNWARERKAIRRRERERRARERRERRDAREAALAAMDIDMEIDIASGEISSAENMQRMTPRARRRAMDWATETARIMAVRRINDSFTDSFLPTSIEFSQDSAEDDHRRTFSNCIRRSELLNLPAVTIRNIEDEIPEENRQCVICFEDFKVGEQRKTLQCCHGFHDTCIDQWLKVNASCPICRH